LFIQIRNDEELEDDDANNNFDAPLRAADALLKPPMMVVRLWHQQIDDDWTRAASRGLSSLLNHKNDATAAAIY